MPSHPNIVYGVGTVQEEVGLRGARTSAAKIQPDIAFGVDVGIAGDTPGISDKEASSKMGEGPQIILYDASMVSHKGLRDFVTRTADELTSRINSMHRRGRDRFRFDPFDGEWSSGLVHHHCHPLYPLSCGHVSS